MRMFKFAVPMILALVIAAGARAEDAKEEKLSGSIAAAPAGGKAGIVAVLTVKGHGKGAEAKTYNLTAEGDVAKQVADFVAKSAKVEVHGSGTTDSFKVTSITEHVKKPK